MPSSIQESSGHIHDESSLNFQAQDRTGGGGVHPKNVPITFDWKFTVSGNHGILTLSNIDLGYVWLNPAYYTWYYCVMFNPPSDNKMKSSPPSCVAIQYGDLTTNGNFEFRWIDSWSIDLGYIGNLANKLNSSGGLDIWVGGCSTYWLTQSNYASPIKISLDSDPSISDLLSYYPFAVRNNNSWYSCNRDDSKLGTGFVKRYTSSGYKDVTNSEIKDDESRNKAFIYTGPSSKIKAPKIGVGK